MKRFQHVTDLGDLRTALAEAFEIKQNRYKYQELGRNKTAMLIFFNNSLRTRLSTQKAAQNLGMNVIVLDVNQGAWKLETERGVIMDSDKSEHLLEAIPVMGSYCDLIGVRSFARFENRQDDYEEKIMQQFIRYSGRPVFFMESATVHPLQAFADLITIEEYKNCAHVEPNPLFGGEAVARTPNKRPKVVLSWAPHPKALPQAVPNSFAEWMLAAANLQTGIEGGMDFVITHPKGYELDPQFVSGAHVEYDQMRAFEGADFIYAKNWSCPGVTQPENYGKVLGDYHDYLDWTVGTRQMAVTNNAFFMHCLPVRRNMIVTDDVIEAPTSIVIPEAANREISATVVLKRMLEALS
ncbi:MAG: acetylornithine carbamoyltransferase [Bacteroidaceae bacterium]|nr:acetylornithine carbamoyltransferase [Bacteroidaceae bacterium]